MSWLIRMGVLRAMSEQAARDPSIRKSDAPARPMSAEDFAADQDLLLSSLGGSRRANMDFRSQQLANMEASERQQAAIRKADEARDAQLGKTGLILPSEERKRKAAAEKAASRKASATPTDDENDEEDGNDDDDDDSGAAPAAIVRDTKVKPGTSNVTHTPSKEGVYAPRDGRTMTTHHTINRKRSTVNKSASNQLLDLANLLTWRSRPA